MRIGPNFAGQEVIDMAPAIPANSGPILSAVISLVTGSYRQDMTTVRRGPNFGVVGFRLTVLGTLVASCCRNFGCLMLLALDVTDEVVVPDIADAAVLVVVAVIWLLLLSLAAVAGHSDCQRAGVLELMLEL